MTFQKLKCLLIVIFNFYLYLLLSKVTFQNINRWIYPIFNDGAFHRSGYKKKMRGVFRTAKGPGTPFFHFYVPACQISFFFFYYFTLMTMIIPIRRFISPFVTVYWLLVYIISFFICNLFWFFFGIKLYSDENLRLWISFFKSDPSPPPAPSLSLDNTLI